MSTSHPDLKIPSLDNLKKTKNILFYNKTKPGSEVIDEIA